MNEKLLLLILVVSAKEHLSAWNCQLLLYVSDIPIGQSICNIKYQPIVIEIHMFS